MSKVLSGKQSSYWDFNSSHIYHPRVRVKIKPVQNKTHHTSYRDLNNYSKCCYDVLQSTVSTQAGIYHQLLAKRSGPRPIITTC